MKGLTWIVLFTLLAVNTGNAQNNMYKIDQYQSNVSESMGYDSIYSISRGVCKVNSIVMGKTTVKPVVGRKIDSYGSIVAFEHTVPFLAIHGKVEYDYFKQSNIDSVSQYGAKNFWQHSEFLYLNVMVKDKFPLVVSLNAHQNNSPFLKNNYFGPNVQLDKNLYQSRLKNQLYEKLKNRILSNEDLKLNEDALDLEKKRLKGLQINNAATLQKIVESRESVYNNKLGRKKPALLTPEIDQVFALQGPKGKSPDFTPISKKVAPDFELKNKKIIEEYEGNKLRYDSVALRIKRLEAKVDTLKKESNSKIAALSQDISHSANVSDLRSIAKVNGLPKDSLSGISNVLGNFKTLSVGSTLADYTELTVKNVKVTGINAEYNSKFYTALLVGKIDYQFNELASFKTLRGQYVSMVRVGIGNFDKSSFIVSIFNGKKGNAGFSYLSNPKSEIPVLGYAVEASFKKADRYFSVEFAKSTKLASLYQPSNKQKKALFDFPDNSNMGINLKAGTTLQETDTHISGFFRKTGDQFQSFSTFSYNTGQTSWQTRVDQFLAHQKVSVSAILRRNDFLNPFAERTYKTSIIFKSIFANAAFPKYPTISVGYYPVTQVYIVDKEHVQENAYYILNGSLVYNYRAAGLQFSSSAFINRYYNKASIIGLVSYKGINYHISQGLEENRKHFEIGYGYNKQPELEYHILEAGTQYWIRSYLRLGADVRYNRVVGGKEYLGQGLSATLELMRFGGIQFQYNKSFLPTISKSLAPVEMGHFTYYKTF